MHQKYNPGCVFTKKKNVQKYDFLSMCSLYFFLTFIVLAAYKMSGLKIYKASAGSGKTYTLAREYISLIFSNPELFKNILAVTFTNKAAAEMKSRILERLYELSQDPKHAEYNAFLVEKYGRSPEQTALRSKKILSDILHHYSRFSVQTIDSFFQRILRSFVMELGMQYNYVLQMDVQKVLSAAIDLLIFESDTHPELRKWLLKFTASKMDEGKSWNLRREIMSLGKELFSEKAKMHARVFRDIITHPQIKNQYLDHLLQQKLRFENTMAGFGRKAISEIENNGWNENDFYQKSRGPILYFHKLAQKASFAPTGYAMHVYETPDKWFPGTHPRAGELKRFVEFTLHPLLVDAIHYNRDHSRQYQTGQLILSQFYAFGLLTDIERYIQEYLREQNEFLISDMAVFLNRIIANNEAPFIYEKAGVLFQHYFLDEFQDTSVFQWENFKPLIQNSLATGHANLVVGDVKQSIYRWRNSDWKILGHRLSDDLKEFNQETHSLDSNFRSRENIVHFNNAFFAASATLVKDKYQSSLADNDAQPSGLTAWQDRITDAYSDVNQKVGRKNMPAGGCVQVQLFEDEAKWQDQVDRTFPATIVNLIKSGKPACEMAILVRDHKQGKRAVEALMEYRKHNDPEGFLDVPIISNESLYLRNAPSVRFLINMLKYMHDPTEQLNLAEMYFEYAQLNQINLEGRHTKDLQDLTRLLFDDDRKREWGYLVKLSLPEIIEGAIRVFKLGDSPDSVPYLNAFMDVAMDYTRSHSSDIHAFIDWWEEEGMDTSLEGDDQGDAIKVMTIHKSKGLQFGYVLIPYASWTFDHGSNKGPILWCNTMAPYNDIPVVPVKYGPKMGESLFASEYFEEKLDSYVDNLNLLYVAFTRAEDGLFAYGPANDTSMNMVAGLMQNVFSMDHTSKPVSLSWSEYWDPESLSFRFGNVPETGKQQPGITSVRLKSYPSWAGYSRLRLQYQSDDYFSVDRLEKIRKGTLLHELFERIGSARDVEPAVQAMVSQGKISGSEQAGMIQHVQELLQHRDVANWFDGHWKVRNEAAILLPNGDSLRPDRLMFKEGKTVLVDYKFGAKKLRVHGNQIQRYMKYLMEMGYGQVQGFLWYVEMGEVEAVFL